MRTFLCKKLKRILKWLRLWMISGKTILTAKEAAIYLKTDVVTIYRLKDRYHLPSHKTQQQLLYFKRKEIDAWLQPRRRRDLPSALDWLNSISSYVKMKYGLEVDKSGKDISRACFLCHDPEVYLNEKYRF